MDALASVPDPCLANQPIDVAACFRAHATWLVRAVRRLTKSQAHAEEIVQETFHFALERRERLREGPGLGAWLYRVARHKALHQLRGNSRARANIDRLSSERPGDSADPYQHLLWQEQLRQLHSALERVEPARREVLLLFEVEELSTEQIARRLGIAAGTVGSRLSRGREELRAVWQSADVRPTQPGTTWGVS